MASRLPAHFLDVTTRTGAEVASRRSIATRRDRHFLLRISRGLHARRIRGPDTPKSVSCIPLPSRVSVSASLAQGGQALQNSSTARTVKPWQPAQSTCTPKTQPGRDLPLTTPPSVALPRLARCVLLPLTEWVPRRDGSRSHRVGPEEPSMDIYYIVSGLGLVFIGIGVADGMRILLEPDIRYFLATYKLAKRRASRPILLEEWNMPRA